MDRGGRNLTILTATSIFGVEAFMVIEGAVNSPVWCYFIAELQKKVFPRLYEKTPGLKERNILLIYDNCSSHVSGYSSWFMTNLRCKKLTITPYTPEFNPVERFFNSIKVKCSDGVKREEVPVITEFVLWNIDQFNANIFKSYF
jgi:transposase